MMSESQALALTSVKRDPTRHLKLGMRETIWSEFGNRATPAGDLSPAHRRRIALAVAGVERVLPLWKKRYGKSDIPQVALSTVEALLAGKRVDAQKVIDKLWGDVVHLSVEEPFPEVAVGFAAVQAISTAMQDELFDSTNLDPEREDGDDPESWDSAFYASVAAAGGVPSDPESNADNRLTFWTWWLNDGIKAAMAGAPRT